MKRHILNVIGILAMTAASAQVCQTSSAPNNNCSSFNDQIDAFTLNGISSPNSPGCSSGGYGSYTTPFWLLLPGQTYTWTASVGNNVYTQGFAIWIDFNNDLVFTSTECVYVGAPSLTHSGAFTVPSGAASTNTMKMRLRNTFGSITSSDMCTAYLNSYGETEDYIVSTQCPTTSTVNIASTNTYVCLGQSVTFTATASGATNYTWSSGGAGSTIVATPSSPGLINYTVTASFGTVCPSATFTAVKSISVTNVPLPVTAVASSSMACAGSPVTLTAVGANNYTWYPSGGNTGTAVVYPPSNTTYTVAAFNGSGCPGAATVAIQTSPVPTIVAMVSSGTICSGETATITLSGANTYTYNNVQVAGNSFTISPSSSTSIPVSGSYSTGCSASTATVLLVSQSPPVSISANQTTVCVNQTVALTAAGAQNFTWTGGPPTPQYAPQVTAPTVFTVTGSNNNNICLGVATITIGILDPTITVVATPTAVCPGGEATLTASGANNFAWNNGLQGPQINVTPSAPTTYTVTGDVTDPNTQLTCASEKTISVGVHPSATIGINPSRTTICRNETVLLTGTGGQSYQWSVNGSTATAITLTANTLAPLNVTVTGTDANGCSNNANLQVKVIACTGLADEALSADISVYPNPAYSQVRIAGAALQIRFINGLGQVVKHATAVPEGTTVDVSDLPAGVYFLTTTDRRVLHKLVIAR